MTFEVNKENITGYKCMEIDNDAEIIIYCSFKYNFMFIITDRMLSLQSISSEPIANKRH